MRSLSRLALAMLFVPACAPVSCEGAEEEASAAPASRAEPQGRWPRALVADLPPATPATVVTVERARVEVSNAALVATWPAAALERARAAAPGGDPPEGRVQARPHDGPQFARRADGDPDWPRLDVTLDAPGDRATSIAALQDVLARARSAERAGSEGGSGAGAFNLRVASDVPFARVERVLYTAAQAGYVVPRILLSAEPTDRMLPWPSAPPRPAPTREQIEAALRGEPAPIAEATEEPRARLDADHLALRMGERSACVLEGALEVRALERCAARLRSESGNDTIALDVDPELGFERVATALQALTRAFEGVRVTSGTRP